MKRLALRSPGFRDVRRSTIDHTVVAGVWDGRSRPRARVHQRSSVAADAGALHIRIDAKRQALDALDAARRSTAHKGDGNGDGGNETEIQTVVEVGDDLTSRSRHSLVCAD